MVDPQTLDFSKLPWLPLDARAAFPRNPAIYFAIDGQGTIQYVGRTVDPKQRWLDHHRYKDLASLDGVRIAYLFVDSPELLPEIEAALIQWFDPPLNAVQPIYPAIPRSTGSLKVRRIVKQEIDVPFFRRSNQAS